MSTDEIDAGARAVYEAARQGIATEPWDALPEWRRWRWRQAFMAAVRVAAEMGATRRPAASVRVA